MMSPESQLREIRGKYPERFSSSPILDLRRQLLIDSALQSDHEWEKKKVERMSGKSAVREMKLSRKDKRQVKKAINAIQEAEISRDQVRKQEIIQELGGVKAEMAGRVIEKVEPVMRRLEKAATAEGEKSPELEEALIDTTTELLRLKNLHKLPQNFGKLREVFHIAGYTAEEARNLVGKVAVSTLTSVGLFIGTNAASGTAVLTLGETVNSFATQVHASQPVEVLAAVAAHLGVLAVSRLVCRANFRLLEAAGFSPDVHILAAHAITTKIAPDNKSLQKKATDAAYWLPKSIEEGLYAPLDLVNPSGAIAAHAATAGILLIRVGVQHIAAHHAEKHKQKLSDIVNDSIRVHPQRSNSE